MSCVYVDGAVHRISPDAPVPVLLRTGTSRRASGACLAAAAVSKNAQDVTIIGVVGDDEPGDFLRMSLRADGIQALLGIMPSCTTITKTRFRTGDHHLLRVDDDSTFAQHSLEVENHILAAWREVRTATSAVLFSDYAKGTLSEAAIAQIVADARKLGARVVVDTKRRDVSCYRGANAWTPNTSELEAAGQTDDHEGWTRTCAWLNLEVLIVTRAEKGATVASNAGGQAHIAAPSIGRVISVAGAGDILAGVVTGLVAKGASWNEAAAAGVRAATEFVGLDLSEQLRSFSGAGDR